MGSSNCGLSAETLHIGITVFRIEKSETTTFDTRVTLTYECAQIVLLEFIKLTTEIHRIVVNYFTEMFMRKYIVAFILLTNFHTKNRDNLISI